MGKTKLDETYIFKISIKMRFFWCRYWYQKIFRFSFFRVLVTIEPGRSLLQFVTTNCLIRIIIHSYGIMSWKGGRSWICFVSFFVEYVWCLFYICFLSEVEEALPSYHEELFDFPTHLLSPNTDDVPVSTFCCFSGPCKLEPDTQELGSTCFDSEGTSQESGFCIMKYFG